MENISVDDCLKILECSGLEISTILHDQKFFLLTSLNLIKYSVNLDDYIKLKLLHKLQEYYNVPVIIQITDIASLINVDINGNSFVDLLFLREDIIKYYGKYFKETPEEILNMNSKQFKKFICEKNSSFKEIFMSLVVKYACEKLVKTVIAFGFKQNQTFIYSTMDYVGQKGGYYQNIIELGSKVSVDEINRGVEWDNSMNIEFLTMKSKELAAMFSDSYKQILNNVSMNCVVLCRPEDTNLLKLAHRIAVQSKRPVPLAIYIPHIPGLQNNGRMDSRDDLSGLFVSETAKSVKNKINKYAFSGGGVSIEEHRANGGNCEVDVCFQYLRRIYFDSDKLDSIRREYSSGNMLTGELKKFTIDLINDLFEKIQNNEAQVTEYEVKSFMTPRQLDLGTRSNSYFITETKQNVREEFNSMDIDGQKKYVELVKIKSEPQEISGDVVTPWEVKGDEEKGIDYDKLIESYGSSKIEQSLIDRFQDVIDVKSHHFLTRGIFYSHRDFDQIVDQLSKFQKDFYLYTGRGPSSDALHLGHMVPFIFTGWLRRVFQVPLVVQLTDDEKCLMRDISQHDVAHMTRENIRDIIAALQLDDCPQDRTTFIFSDFRYTSEEPAFFRTASRIRNKVNMTSINAIFGFTAQDCVEKIAFPAAQAATSFSVAFPTLFGLDNPCKQSLIPCAIDQDPYFRMTRDVAPKLRLPKPALIHSKFFPSLLGRSGKMSASDPNSAIFMTDSADDIRKKLLHGEYNQQQNEICLEYLTFFLEDEYLLSSISNQVAAGTISNREIREHLVGILIPLVEEHQRRRANVTDAMIDWFMTPRALQ